jgi:hypothetical protein
MRQSEVPEETVMRLGTALTTLPACLVRRGSAESRNDSLPAFFLGAPGGATGWESRRARGRESAQDTVAPQEFKAFKSREKIIPAALFHFENFHLFGFVSDFGFRISDLPLRRVVLFTALGLRGGPAAHARGRLVE